MKGRAPHCITCWGCSTVRTMVSLQRLLRDSRKWRGLDNATRGAALKEQFLSAALLLFLGCKRTESSTGLLLML